MGKIGLALEIDEPGPMGLYLGCIHEEGKLTLPCGRDIRYCTFNSEDFFRDKVNRYLEICETLGGKKVKLASVTTPYLRESSHENRRTTAKRPTCASGVDILFRLKEPNQYHLRMERCYIAHGAFVQYLQLHYSSPATS